MLPFGGFASVYRWYSKKCYWTLAPSTEIPSLKLRLLKEEDAEELSLRVDENREHLRRWLPWLDGAKDISGQLKFIQRCSERAAAGTTLYYAILSGGEIVGMVSFNNIEKLNRCAIGISLQLRMCL